MIFTKYTTDRGEMLDFVRKTFKNINPELIEKVRTTTPRHLCVNYNDETGKGVVAYCHHLITKTGLNYASLELAMCKDDLFEEAI